MKLKTKIKAGKALCQPQPHRSLIGLAVRVLCQRHRQHIDPRPDRRGSPLENPHGNTAFARTFARLLSDRGGLTRTLLAVGLLVLAWLVLMGCSGAGDSV